MAVGVRVRDMDRAVRERRSPPHPRPLRRAVDQAEWPLAHKVGGVRRVRVLGLRLQSAAHCGMMDVARAGADRLERWAHFDRLSGADDMTKLLGFVGATIGGYAGWALGALAGPFAGFIVSMIGT